MTGVTLASMSLLDHGFGDSNSQDAWLTSSSLVLNAPMSEEQRDLQTQRRQLLKTHRNIMARLDIPHYVLSANNHEELNLLKKRLEHCALDAPDFRELLEDLSEFQEAIQSTLDRQDEGVFASSKRAREEVGSWKSLKRAATVEAHTSGGSGSDREHQNEKTRVAASVGSSKSLKRATFEGSGGSGSDRSDREHPIHDQNSLGQLRLLAAVLGSPGVSTPGDPGSNLSEPLSDEQEPAAKRSGRRGDGAAPK